MATEKAWWTKDHTKSAVKKCWAIYVGSWKRETILHHSFWKHSNFQKNWIWCILHRPEWVMNTTASLMKYRRQFFSYLEMLRFWQVDVLQSSRLLLETCSVRTSWTVSCLVSKHQSTFQMSGSQIIHAHGWHVKRLKESCWPANYS